MTKFYSVISKFNTVMPYYTQLAHTACQTQDWLKVNCTDFIAKDEWPPNSPDLNPLDYHVWGAMLQAFHKLHPKSKTIPQLKVHCSRSGMTCRRQQSTKLLMNFANIWTHVPRPVMGILNMQYEVLQEYFDWTLFAVSETVINYVLTRCLSSSSKISC